MRLESLTRVSPSSTSCVSLISYLGAFCSAFTSQGPVSGSFSAVMPLRARRRQIVIPIGSHPQHFILLPPVSRYTQDTGSRPVRLDGSRRRGVDSVRRELVSEKLRRNEAAGT